MKLNDTYGVKAAPAPVLVPGTWLALARSVESNPAVPESSRQWARDLLREHSAGVNPSGKEQR